MVSLALILLGLALVVMGVLLLSIRGRRSTAIGIGGFVLIAAGIAAFVVGLTMPGDFLRF